MKLSLFGGAVGRLCFVMFYTVFFLAFYGSMHLIWGMFENGCRVAQPFYFLNLYFTPLKGLDLLSPTNLIIDASGVFSSPWRSNALYGSPQDNLDKRLRVDVDFCFVMIFSLSYVGVRLFFTQTVRAATYWVLKVKDSMSLMGLLPSCHSPFFLTCANG